MNSLSEYATDEEFDFLEPLLISTHKLAVQALMRIAEGLGIDSTLIQVSGRYCRELQWPIDRMKPVMWPECIGEAVCRLPPDVREAIANGNAAVERVATIRASRGWTGSRNLTGITAEIPEPMKDDPKSIPTVVQSRMTVTISEVATAAFKAPSSMTERVREWGKPIVSKSGRRPARFCLNEIRPVIQTQFGDESERILNELKAVAKPL